MHFKDKFLYIICIRIKTVISFWLINSLNRVFDVFIIDIIVKNSYLNIEVLKVIFQFFLVKACLTFFKQCLITSMELELNAGTKAFKWIILSIFYAKIIFQIIINTPSYYIEMALVV